MSRILAALFISTVCIFFLLLEGGFAADTCAERYANTTECCNSTDGLNCVLAVCYNVSDTDSKQVPQCVNSTYSDTLNTTCKQTFEDQCAAAPSPTTPTTQPTSTTDGSQTTPTTQPSSTQNKASTSAQTSQPTTQTSQQPTTQTDAPTSEKTDAATKQGPTTASTTTTTTQKPQGGFDAGSFIGGIVLASGLFLIGIFAYKFYKSRSDKNYHTL